MMRTARQSNFIAERGRPVRGMALVFVLMIALGLVSVTLYFANTMVMEYRGADNDAAGIVAGQASEGARRYLLSMLKNKPTPGRMPTLDTYQAKAVAVGGDAKFWLIGRDPDAAKPTDRPVFGLIDEASKLNINTASPALLQGLPGMTAELAASIKDWRDADDEPTDGGGAESEAYQQLSPAYSCKNSKFESIEELRLVQGATWAILYGEDANRNGLLDPNENDGSILPPNDNQDGKLDPGILEYVTVWSREPNKKKDGTPRTSIRRNGSDRALAQLFKDNFNDDRWTAILVKLGGPGGLRNIRSVLEFYKRSGLTEADFTKIEDSLTVSNNDFTTGSVNVNTAPEAVLDCLPGLSGTSHAAELIAYRHGKTPDDLASIAWVANVLDEKTAYALGPYITTRSYQFSADVVSLGYLDRGMRRDLFVIDTSSDGEPRVLYHRDLGRLGWPLGNAMREELRLATQK